MNFKVRAKNPVFWVSVLLAACTPVLAYFGISGHDLTTWTAVFWLIQKTYSNPYALFVFAVALYNALVDTTTPGIGDNVRVRDAHSPRDLTGEYLEDFRDAAFRE